MAKPGQSPEERVDQDDFDDTLRKLDPLPALPPSPCVKALAAARLEFESIQKTKTAKIQGTSRQGRPYEYEYKYASLDDILAAVTPALSRHGLVLTQRFYFGASGGICLETKLIHESGDSIEPAVLPIGTHADMKALGSEITYLRRYAVTALLCVGTEEDTDGAGSEGRAGAIAQPGSRPRDEPGERRRNGVKFVEDLLDSLLKWRSQEQGHKYAHQVAYDLTGFGTMEEMLEQAPLNLIEDLCRHAKDGQSRIHKCAALVVGETRRPEDVAPANWPPPPEPDPQGSQ